MSRNQLIITISGSLIAFFLIFVFTGLIPGLRPDPKLAPKPQITQIKLWGFEHDASGWQSVINSYESSHPNVDIQYTAVLEANYENYLIDNLAAGTGPDIFVLQNSWFPKFRAKISSAPENLITLTKIKDLFPPVVTADFVSSGQVWGLPVSIDTLALAYNRDIFDAKQIATPPATWNDLRNLVPRIREFNSGVLSKSAIALGGAEASVTNATDILSAIMLQFKNQIIDLPLRKATINNSTGLQALNLYTGFSDPQNSAYAWNSSFGNSLDSFVNGKTAMALLYKRQINEIKLKNPILNLIVASLPQSDINNPITIANYFGLVVANQSRNQSMAWDFINFASTNNGAQKLYVNASKLPPALRSLVPDYQNDPLMQVFASQILTAKSVPYIQYPTVSGALNNMIESTLTDRSTAQANLKVAEDKINAIITQ